MTPIEITLIMSLIVLIAYLVKGMTGFGEGLLIIPPLLLLFDIKYLLPITAVIMFLADLYLIYHFRKDFHKGSIFILLISAVVGVIIGTYLLNILDSNIIKILLAIFIILFSLRLLFFENTKKGKLFKKSLGVISGFLGGLIDAIFGTGGPPVIMYLSYIGMNKSAFRATCTITFLFYHTTRLIAYSYSGIMTLESIKIGLMLIPAMMVGSVIGMKLHFKIDEKIFKKIVGLILLIVGIVLLI